MKTITDKIRAELEWVQSGQWTLEQSVTRMLYLIRAEIIALPTHEWDPNDADSAEARSARAYNSARVDIWTKFKQEGK